MSVTSTTDEAEEEVEAPTPSGAGRIVSDKQRPQGNGCGLFLGRGALLVLALIGLTVKPALGSLGITLPRHSSEAALALIGLGAIIAVALAVAALWRLSALLRSRDRGRTAATRGTASTRLRTQEFCRRR
jgi:hypothetical protein